MYIPSVLTGSGRKMTRKIEKCRRLGEEGSAEVFPCLPEVCWCRCLLQRGTRLSSAQAELWKEYASYNMKNMQ